MSEPLNVPPADRESVKEMKTALEDKWAEEDMNSENQETQEQVVENAAAVDGDVLQKMIDERDEYIGHLQRLQAEFDNYRKRVQREKAEMTQFLLQGFITQLLTVADHMERAIHSAQAANDVDSYRQGVDMVFQKFMNILKEQGVTKIESVGQPFDPNLHEAIGQVATGEFEPGTVVNEISPGYMLKERVLQAPKVQVAVRPIEASGDGGNANTDNGN